MTRVERVNKKKVCDILYITVMDSFKVWVKVMRKTGVLLEET